MINVICTNESWGELLDRLPERDRFSMPSEYVDYLVDRCGRPLYMEMETPRGKVGLHIYPPERVGS